MPIKKKSVRRKMRREDRHKGEIEHQEEVDDKVGEVSSDQPLCNVGYSLKRTYNMGDYNSVSVEVSIHVPCEVDDVDEAFESAESWVQDKLEETFNNLGVAD